MANYNDRGLGINNLTIGVSTGGVEQYMSDLKQSLLLNVKEKIDDVKSVVAALDKGWQGESRDAFERIFEARREEVKTDLESEYANVAARLSELAYNYVQQDKQMIIE